MGGLRSSFSLGFGVQLVLGGNPEGGFLCRLAFVSVLLVYVFLVPVHCVFMVPTKIVKFIIFLVYMLLYVANIY